MKKLVKSISMLFVLTLSLSGFLVAQNGGEKVSEEELAKRPEVINKILEEGPIDLLSTFVDTITDPVEKIKVIVSLLGDQRARGGRVERALKNAFGIAWYKLEYDQQKNLLSMLEEDKTFKNDKDLLAYKIAALAYGSLRSESEEYTGQDWEKNLQEIGTLLEKGAHPNPKVKVLRPDIAEEFKVTGLVPLVDYAMFSNDYDLALMLLKSGAKLEKTENFDPYEALKSAWDNEDLPEEKLLEIAQIIAEAKLDPNFESSSGWTPLMIAASNGDEDTVKALIWLGAVIDIKTKEGWTPLSGALTNKHAKVAKILLNAGAKHQFVGGTEGTTPLHSAGDAVEVIKMLLAQGAQIDKLDDTGHTPLMHMAMEDASEGADLLLAAGANVFKLDTKQNNALHHAATSDSVAVARLLLEKTKIDVNSKNRKQFTPLMMAAITGSPELVQLLINHGADPLIQNDRGQTALDLAKLHNRQAIVEVLEASETDSE